MLANSLGVLSLDFEWQDTKRAKPQIFFYKPEMGGSTPHSALRSPKFEMRGPIFMCVSVPISQAALSRLEGTWGLSETHGRTHAYMHARTYARTRVRTRTRACTRRHAVHCTRTAHKDMRELVPSWVPRPLVRWHVTGQSWHAQDTGHPSGCRRSTFAPCDTTSTGFRAEKN